MKPGIIAFLIAVLALAGLVWQASEANRLSKENARLREQMAVFAAAAVPGEAAASPSAAGKDEAQVRELARLRSEVAQLRTAANEAAKAKAANDRLRAEPKIPPAAPALGNASAPGEAGTFTRESWSNAGYASPEAALVTAIWAMKEGDPRTYLASLAPEEHARISKAWENKSEAEVAAKHQADVSNITSLRVLERQEVSPDQMTLSVFIDGVSRFEKVSMLRVGNEWKFKGFIRDPQPQ